MFYIDEFLMYLRAERYYKKPTVKSYALLLKQFENWCRTNQIPNVKNITKMNIFTYLKQLKQVYLSERVYYLKISQLKNYFNFLEEKGYIFLNNLKDYKFSKYLRQHHPVLREEEIERILNNIKTSCPLCHKGKTVIELAYSSALRPAKIANLKIQDIDINKGQLFINQAKGKKDRIVPVGKRALEELLDYINTTRKRYLKPDSPDNVFLSFKMGLPHNSYGIRWVIQETLRKNGFNPIRPYSLRGTSATALFLNGMGIAYINKLLGHTSFKTTKLYLRVDDMDLKKVLKKNHPRLHFKEEKDEV